MTTPVFKTVLKTECPCGQQVHVVESPSGDQGVVHMLPRCETFDALDAVEYVKWLRLNAEGKLDS